MTEALVYRLVQIELILVTAAVTALIGFVIGQWRKSRALEAAVKSMLKHNIVKAHQSSIKAGSTSMQMRESVHDMAREYEALKGNSFVKELVAEIDEMPLRDVAKSKCNCDD